MLRRFWKRNYSIAHDFEPHSVIKVISRSGSKPKVPDKQIKKDVSVKKSEIPAQKVESGNVNAMGIQMISRKLKEQIFRNANTSSVDPELIDK